MPAVFVDIWNELADLDREATHLSTALARHDDTQASNPQHTWEQTHLRASAIEKIYSGCERIMARLATEIDGASMTRSEGWHVGLLKRMAHPFPEIRGPIVSADCYSRLDRLRAFRHRIRNSYGIDLDPGIVLERAHEAVATLRLFREEIRQFMAQHGFEPNESG